MAQDVVKISELKRRLSEYLRRVRAGEVLLVCDRDQVVARIEPAGGRGNEGGDDARWLSELERRGTIRRAATSLRRGWLASRPEVGADLVAALLAERDDGR
jgi:antitoxin (DNA-binding transcriptional repressor) of toxin-antitoxin stability system